MIKDVLKGAGWALLLIPSFVLLGWGFGMLATKILSFGTKRFTPQPIWYCIEGKVYEKISDTYVTVVPARTCLPVIKE